MPRLQEHLDGILDFMGDLDGELIQIVDTDDGEYLISVYYNEIEEGDKRSEIIVIDDITNFTNPFNVSDQASIKQFIQTISYMTIQTKNVRTYPSLTGIDDIKSCINWDMKINYDFTSHSQINARMDIDCDFCNSDNYQNYGYNYIWIHILVLILASASLFVSLKYIYEVGMIYIK